MIEAAAEGDEALTDKYLETARRCRDDEIKRGLQARARSGTRSCCACAARRSRTRACRRCSTRSSSSCRRRSRCRRPRASTRTAKPSRAPPRDDEPFSALAFKILNDPFVGNLTFFRVYSGMLNSGDTVFVPAQVARRSASGACCRCTPTSAARSRKSAPATSPRPWVSRTSTPATRCAIPRRSSRSRRWTFPIPVISVAVEPKTKADQEKMGLALQRLAKEDPSFRVSHRPGVRPDDHLRHGRAAPRNHRRPHEARVQGRGERRQAAGRLPRDHPRQGRERRQVRAPVRRPRPVRSRVAQARAATSRARATSSSTASSAASCRASTSRPSTRASRKHSRPA